MHKTTRRGFLTSAAARVGGVGSARFYGVQTRAAVTHRNHVRIERIAHRFEEHAFRVPLKFALAVVNRQTMLTVDCTVRTATGKVATGFGTLPLNYVFTFPSKRLSEEA